LRELVEADVRRLEAAAASLGNVVAPQTRALVPSFVGAPSGTAQTICAVYLVDAFIRAVGGCGFFWLSGWGDLLAVHVGPFAHFIGAHGNRFERCGSARKFHIRVIGTAFQGEVRDAKQAILHKRSRFREICGDDPDCRAALRDVLEGVEMAVRLSDMVKVRPAAPDPPSF